MSSPKLRANAICWSSVIGWSRKKSTFHCTRARSISATTSGSSGSDSATPWTSAPMTVVTGRISKSVGIVVLLTATRYRTGRPEVPARE